MSTPAEVDDYIRAITFSLKELTNASRAAVMLPGIWFPLPGSFGASDVERIKNSSPINSWRTSIGARPGREGKKALFFHASAHNFPLKFEK